MTEDPKALAALPAGTAKDAANDITAPTLYWEDFPPGHQRRVGGTTLTREAIVEFAGRYDPQPFHLDEGAARESLFGGLCASGWHTAALTMRMLCDGYLLRAASLGSPGIDQLRWLAPVFPGDTLWVEYAVLSARPMASRPGVGLAQMRWTVVNQHDKPVMTMEGWGMFRRRPGWEADMLPSTAAPPPGAPEATTPSPSGSPAPGLAVSPAPPASNTLPSAPA